MTSTFNAGRTCRLEQLADEMKRLAREDEELRRRLVRLAELKDALGDKVGRRR